MPVSWLCKNEPLDLDSIINLAAKVADFFGLDKSHIKPISSASLNQPAKRPPRTGFILDKARIELGYTPRTFVEGLKIVSAQLLQKQN
jgi:dTDP-4-dehydrorhamnose reductase